jgi:hypothetical protein
MLSTENQDQDIADNHAEISYYVEEQKIITLKMFIVLCIVSFNLYSLWWIYKEWRFFRQKERSEIMPALMTIFSIITMASLFNKILRFAKEKGYSHNYFSIALFCGYIIGNLLSTLSDALGLISVLSFVFIIPPFKALNYAKQNSNDFIVTEQSSFNGQQIGLLIVGSIFWILVLLGLIIGNG